MLQPQKFELKMKYEGSSQGKDISGFVKYLYKSVHTSSVCDTIGKKNDSKQTQVNAEKYITI